ncbi:MAG TPA: bifunctional oligoribonuclease/PAP phosphatase NrnA [Acidobacteriaceae bacterium]|nr:bifunctional oligoribonuclease/PAP phosphatase NrnA [Acidobacteriaceae bacterium]
MSALDLNGPNSNGPGTNDPGTNGPGKNLTAWSSQPSTGAPEQVLEAIQQRQSFLVTAHARPDGDAIGSMLACCAMLEQMGKHVELVLHDRVPTIYRALPGAERIRCAPAVERVAIGRNYDAVILLECDNIERTRLQGLAGQFLINIDHHASGREFAQINWIDTRPNAVAEMVYRLALLAGVTITPAMATCLYTALLTDTGAFCYQGTQAQTFELARDLAEHGADPSQVARNVYFSNPAAKMRLLGAALATLQLEGKIAWLWVTHSDMLRHGAEEEDCEGIVNYAISISGVEVAIFLRELPDNRFRLSLRSKSLHNVAQVAEVLGGGGHKHASGCTLEGPLFAAIDCVLKELRQQLPAATVPSVATLEAVPAQIASEMFRKPPNS